MICKHLSIKAGLKGQTDQCITCQLHIIFDGAKWVWLYGMDREKRRKMIQMFNVDRITGAHA